MANANSTENNIVYEEWKHRDVGKALGAKFKKVYNLIAKGEKFRGLLMATLSSSHTTHGLQESEMRQLINFSVYAAADIGDENTLTHLLSSSLQPDVNGYRDGFGSSPIMAAASRGRLNCLKVLINFGANTNDATTPSSDRIFGTEGVTALMKAAEGGHLECVQCLIQNRAYPHVFDGKLRSLLNYAAKNGHVKVITYLKSRGFCINTKHPGGPSALVSALDEGKEDCAEYLIENGIDVHTGIPGRVNPLVMALNKDLLLPALCLLQNDAHMHDQDPDTYVTGIWRASQHLAVLRLLIDRGATLTGKDPKDRTPFLLASQHGTVAHLKSLLAMGSDLNEVGMDNRTALMYACLGANFENLTFLYRQGLSLREPDTSGKTPLHHATFPKSSNEKEGEKCVKFLIEHGCERDVNRPDMHGWTPAMYSIISCTPSAMRCLKRVGGFFANRDMKADPAFVFLFTHSQEDNDYKKRIARGLKYMATDKERENAVIDTFSKMMFDDMYHDEGFFHMLSFKFEYPRMYDHIRMFYGQILCELPHWKIQTLYQNEVLPLLGTRGEKLPAKIEGGVLTFLLLNNCISYTQVKELLKKLLDVNALIKYSYLALVGSSSSSSEEENDESFWVPQVERQERLIILSSEDQAAENQLIQYKSNDTAAIVHGLVTNPWPLVKLSFLVASANLGFGIERTDNVDRALAALASPLATEGIIEALLFKQLNRLLCPDQWSELRLQLHPDNYRQVIQGVDHAETGDSDSSTLLHWPVGLQHGSCDCNHCDDIWRGRGVKYITPEHPAIPGRTIRKDSLSQSEDEEPGSGSDTTVSDSELQQDEDDDDIPDTEPDVNSDNNPAPHSLVSFDPPSDSSNISPSESPAKQRKQE